MTKCNNKISTSVSITLSTSARLIGQHNSISFWQPYPNVESFQIKSFSALFNYFFISHWNLWIAASSERKNESKKDFFDKENLAHNYWYFSPRNLTEKGYLFHKNFQFLFSMMFPSWRLVFGSLGAVLSTCCPSKIMNKLRSCDFDTRADSFDNYHERRL